MADKAIGHFFSRGEAFHSNNWTWQAKMMDALLTALERSLVGFK